MVASHVRFANKKTNVKQNWENASRHQCMMLKSLLPSKKRYSWLHSFGRTLYFSEKRHPGILSKSFRQLKWPACKLNGRIITRKERNSSPSIPVEFARHGGHHQKIAFKGSGRCKCVTIHGIFFGMSPSVKVLSRVLNALQTKLLWPSGLLLLTRKIYHPRHNF